MILAPTLPASPGLHGLDFGLHQLRLLLHPTDVGPPKKRHTIRTAGAIRMVCEPAWLSGFFVLQLFLS